MPILRKEDLNDTTWKIISVSHIGDKPSTDRLENNYCSKFCADGLYREENCTFTDKLLNNGMWTLDESTNMVCIRHRKSKYFKRAFTILSYDQDLQQMTTQVYHFSNACGIYTTYDRIIWEKVS